MDTTTSNQAQKESSVVVSQQLQNEVDVLVRVRNRFASSPDSSLAKILTGLLPRLLRKLNDNNLCILETESNDLVNHQELVLLRQQVQGHALGICSHVIQRIKANNNSIPVAGWVDAILNCLAEFQSQLARTMVLTLLETAVQQPSNDDYTWPLNALLEFMDGLYQTIISIQSQEEESVKEADVANLMTACWLVIQFVGKQMKFPPMRDWDLMECSQTTTTNLDVSCSIQTEIVQSNGSFGLFDWMLDLCISRFGGSLSPFGWKRISQHGRRQQQQELVGTSWSNNQGSQACLDAIVVSLFRLGAIPIGGSTGLFSEEQSLTLCILVASGGSTLGRLAADGLNTYLGHEKLTKVGNVFVTTNKPRCTLNMAISLFILILGDENALETLQSHSDGHESLFLWESNCLGPRPTVDVFQRVPLPTSLAMRAVDFIQNHLSLIMEDGMERLLDEIDIFLALLVSVEKNLNDSVVSHAVVPLFHKLYTEIHRHPGFLSTYKDWVESFHDKCMEASVHCLSKMTDRWDVLFNDSSFQETMMDDLQRQQQRVPLFTRPDLDRLVERHRKSQQRKRFKNDEHCTKARQSAYELISMLASSPRPVVDIHSFQIPTLLFRCLVADENDKCTSSKLLKALSVLLSHHVKAFTTTSDVVIGTVQQMKETSMLLTTLIETLYNGASSLEARGMAVKWITRFLCIVDPCAARYLCTDLVQSSEDKMIRKQAQSVLVAVIAKQPEKEVELTSTSDVVVPRFGYIHTADTEGRAFIQEALSQKIVMVSKKCNVSKSVATTLLLEFCFDMDGLFLAFSNDSRGVLEQVGANSRHLQTETASVSRNDIEEMETVHQCGICYQDELPKNMVFSLPCGHFFCLDCWKLYLQCDEKEGTKKNQLLSCACPYHDCNEKVTQSDLSEIDPDLANKYQQVLLDEFLLRDPYWSVCPAPDCALAATCCVTRQRMGNVVTCKDCNTTYCFSCGSRPHNPATCKDHHQWSMLCGNSRFWINKNTKQCPECSAPIEKRDGCNHMTCSQCNCEFCWICCCRLGNHLEPHACSPYVPSENVESETERRAQFYSERYQAHDDAEGWSRRHLEAFNDEMQSAVDKIHYVSDREVEILGNAREMLVSCRGYIKNTFVVLFAMGNTSQEDLLTDIGNLETALEHFAEKLTRLSRQPLAEVYMSRGELGMQMHVRSIATYTFFLDEYVKRMNVLLQKRA